MRKMYLFIALILMSGFIFAQQTKQMAVSNLSSTKITKVINSNQDSPKAIIDSLHYDGDPFTAIGTNDANTFEVYAFFPAAQLSAHNAMGNTIPVVKVYINGVADVTSTQLKFYSDQGTTMVYNQAFTPVEGWNSVTLTTPLPIPATDLYIGYECVADTGYPLGCDAGPENTNGNWIVVGGTWYHLTDLSATLTYNWNIRAMVDGTAPTTPIASCTPLSWDAGSVQVSQNATSGTFTLTNVGGDTLTSSSITGISAPFTTTFVPASVNLTGGQSVTFTFTYSPTVAGTDNQTAVITTNGGNISIALTGTGVVCPIISTYPFTEGFEADFPPSCWTLIDADGDTHNWETINSADDGWTTHGGVVCAVSASFQGGPYTQDNYLITPKLNINAANLALKFWVAAQDPDWPAEHYSIMVSTTGTVPANFTEVFNETLANSSWHQNTVSLATYNGQNIYIAFRHWNVTTYYMKIDDILVDYVTNISNNDLQSIRIYPNPAKNTLYVANSSNQTVEIYNLTGELVLSSNKNVVDISKLSQSTYFVRVITDSKVITEKINIVR